MTTTTSNQQIVPTTTMASAPSWSQTFLERAKAELTSAAPPVEAMQYVRETGSLAVDYTEGGLTGALLGTTHARYGLDSPYGPVDAWLAVLGAVFGVAASAHAPFLAARARGVGAKAFTILSFRKAYELIGHEPLAGGIAGGVRRMQIAAPDRGPGVTKVDPIEQAAEALEI
jgi:hypothetical protein